MSNVGSYALRSAPALLTAIRDYLIARPKFQVEEVARSSRTAVDEKREIVSDRR